MTRGKAATIALGHIGVIVSDLDVSEGFYQEVLGLRVVDEFLKSPVRYAAMARDGKTVLTLWEGSSGHGRKHWAGFHHLAFEAESVEEVNRTKGRLNNLGMHWIEGARIHPEGSRAAAIHFEDPDGIRIELYSTERAAALEQYRSGSESAIEGVDRAERLSNQFLGGDQALPAEQIRGNRTVNLLEVSVKRHDW